MASSYQMVATPTSNQPQLTAASVAALSEMGLIDKAPQMALNNATTVTRPAGPYQCRATQRTPRWDLLTDPLEPLAYDVEMQDYIKPGMAKWGHRQGRSAVTRARTGEVVLDVYSNYPDENGMRKKLPRAKSKDFGVEWADLKPKNGAKPAKQVEKWLKDMFEGRTVVVHGGANDLTSFYYETDAFSKEKNGVTFVDTQKIYSHLQDDGTPGLRTTALAVLEKDIQVGGFHSPVEDARTTMILYLRQYPYNPLARPMPKVGPVRKNVQSGPVQKVELKKMEVKKAEVKKAEVKKAEVKKAEVKKVEAKKVIVEKGGNGGPTHVKSNSNAAILSSQQKASKNGGFQKDGNTGPRQVENAPKASKLPPHVLASMRGILKKAAEAGQDQDASKPPPHVVASMQGILKKAGSSGPSQVKS